MTVSHRYRRGASCGVPLYFQTKLHHSVIEARKLPLC